LKIPDDLPDFWQNRKLKEKKFWMWRNQFFGGSRGSGGISFLLEEVVDLEDSVVLEEVVDLEESVFLDEVSDPEDRVMFENILKKKKQILCSWSREKSATKHCNKCRICDSYVHESCFPKAILIEKHGELR
jgi:hypothetical protein